MAGGDTKRSSKHKKDDREHKSKRKHKSEKDDSSSTRKRSRKDDGDHLHIVDEDPDDDMWVEKNIDMDGERVRGQTSRSHSKAPS